MKGTESVAHISRGTFTLALCTCARPICIVAIYSAEGIAYNCHVNANTDLVLKM